MTKWREYQQESMLLDSQNGVSEMAKHYEKVWCDFGRPLCRPGIEWCVPDACLTRSLRNMLWNLVFASTPALTSPQF